MLAIFTFQQRLTFYTPIPKRNVRPSSTKSLEGLGIVDIDSFCLEFLKRRSHDIELGGTSKVDCQN